LATVSLAECGASTAQPEQQKAMTAIMSNGFISDLPFAVSGK
jgi:hypothetical protein